MSTQESDQLPRHTTPTWEVELLISGVAVFAMLQLPDLLDRMILESAPRFIDRWAKLLWLVYIYAKSAALILAATFVIHLLLRARWIALVGMLSIYPRGVDWNNFQLGPNAREIEAQRLGRMEDAIDRADNRATMVFALGVVLASILCMITLVVAVMLGAAWILETRLHYSVNTNWIAWSAAVVMVPYGVAMLFDRRFGDQLAPNGLTARGLRAVLRGYTRFGIGMANNPALALLSSHRGRRRTILMIVGVFMLAVFAASTSYYLAREPDALGSYEGYPDADALHTRQLDAAHYDDRRDPMRSRVAPYIQSAVVTGPYVELVIPWEPDRDGPAMRRACGANADPLACYASHVRGVFVDGTRQPVAFELGEDARTDRPAVVAMIDVRGLAPGRHELRITRAQRIRDEDSQRVDPLKPMKRDAAYEVLPFWR
ncbi:hypothetical protein LYSHEL_31240 [Lysobacter helvus]|uniref:Uncharacterized protein n=2 Tax=Lysobacteraceae TaxID=32033 RepID=A0ABN6G2I4_9GAMM|nr:MULTISPECIES: hypothetical protein [Lysobacter]BCT94097.1 hypothetical protein LYSCAS_31210 [Lysobacter caseinilyticus]BCT97253.1 hypothetical protein LYSHEL_31240 [Lysobacter helvus]